jgi:hypothetical protein
MEPDQLPVDGIQRLRVGVEQNRGWLDANDPDQDACNWKKQPIEQNV